jgi:plasmid maintenance system antidote protein VapI
LRLSELFRVTPEFWMNLQAGWDLWHARRQRQARGEAGSIRPIAARA